MFLLLNLFSLCLRMPILRAVAALALVAAPILVLPLLALAQGDAPEGDSLSALAIALVTAATPMLLAAVKWAAPKIPKNILPFLAPFVGALADMLVHVVTGLNLPPIAAALAGLAGVGAREAYDQLRKRWESVEAAEERKLTGR